MNHSGSPSFFFNFDPRTHFLIQSDYLGRKKIMTAIFRATKAATVAEFATLTSLTFTLGLTIFVALNNFGEGLYRDGQRDPTLLSDRITENCLARTRANDTVAARQAKPYNCFRLNQGNDRITIDSGDNIIYPGTGRNIVTIQPGARATQVVYEGGEDILHFGGGTSILDLRIFNLDEITFNIIRKSPSTMAPGTPFDPTHRPATDLLIRTPQGMIIVADHFDNKSVYMIALKGTRLFEDEIVQATIADQISSKSGRVLGTSGLDIISPGAGDSYVELFEGDDVVTYTSGHDLYEAGPGRDILEIPGVKSEDVNFSVSENMADIIIQINNARSIVLIDQGVNGPNSQNVKFFMIQFDNESLHHNDILRRQWLTRGHQVMIISGEHGIRIPYTPGPASTSFTPDRGATRSCMRAEPTRF